MKRIAILVLLAAAGAGALIAQPGPGMGMGMGPMARQGSPKEAPKSVTIEGKLAIIDQYPAVQAKDKTYMLMWRDFYFYAYTDGIKEGAQVKAEGYAMPTMPGQDKPFFLASSVTIGAKTYDTQERGGPGTIPGPMGMMGGRDDGRRGPGMDREDRDDRGMMGRRDNERGPGMGFRQQREAPKSSSLEGKLAIVDKSPALQVKDKTYILRWPGFFYDLYADGIKEGAQVKVEGYEMPAQAGQDKAYFFVTKATIGSKIYDIRDEGPGFGPGGCGMMGGPAGRW